MCKAVCAAARFLHTHQGVQGPDPRRAATTAKPHPRLRSTTQSAASPTIHAAVSRTSQQAMVTSNIGDSFSTGSLQRHRAPHPPPKLKRAALAVAAAGYLAHLMKRAGDAAADDDLPAPAVLQCLRTNSLVRDDGGEALGVVGWMHDDQGAQVALMGCRMLVSLLANDMATVATLSAGGSGACDAVAAALRGHPMLCDIAAEACAVVALLCRDPVDLGSPRLASGRYAIPVAHAVPVATGDGARQEGAAGAPAVAVAVPLDNSENRARLGDLCECLIATMTCFPKEPTVQANGCWALAKLAGDSRNCARIVKAGGCIVVAAALRAFPKDARVQRHACGALQHLATAWDSYEQLKAADAAQLVVEALLAFPRSAGLQRAGLRALSAIGRDPFQRASINSLACDALGSALANHGAAAAVCAAAADAAATLAADPDLQTILCLQLVPQAVVAAMRSQPADAALQHACCSAIAALGGPESGPEAEPMCSAVTSVLATFPGDAAMQRAACAAVAHLARHAPARRHLGRHGVCRGVTAAFSVDTADAALAASACDAVAALAEDPGPQMALGMLGACELVAAAMGEFPGDGALQRSACSAVRALAQKPQVGNTPFLVQARVERLVAAAMMHFPEDEVLQVQGASALALLWNGAHHRRRLRSVGVEVRPASEPLRSPLRSPARHSKAVRVQLGDKRVVVVEQS